MSTILLVISAIMGGIIVKFTNYLQDFTIICLCVLNTLTKKFTYQV